MSKIIILKEEIVSIGVRQPNGSYKKERFKSDYINGKYIPIDDVFLLPIEMDKVNNLSKNGLISGLDVLEPRISSIK